MPAPVIVVEYDPSWPDTLRTLAGTVAEVMGNLALAIEHLGSTAVPNLAAKPIVDMDVVVPSEHDIPPAIERLSTLGYVHEGDLGIKGREAFSSPAGSPQHHLYLCAADSPELRRHLLLRDFLRAHPEAARRYGDIKRAAAELFRDNRQGYMAAKDAVVKEILRSAEEEPAIGRRIASGVVGARFYRATLQWIVTGCPIESGTYLDEER